MPFVVTWMQLESINEVKSKRKTTYITYKFNLNQDTNKLMSETEADYRWRTDLWLPKQKTGVWGRDGLGFGISQYKQLYVKGINKV